MIDWVAMGRCLRVVRDHVVLTMSAGLFRIAFQNGVATDRMLRLTGLSHIQRGHYQLENALKNTKDTVSVQRRRFAQPQDCQDAAFESEKLGQDGLSKS